ncbi:MAG: hypothetical protein N838_15925 [Thiohalocapsa sp. PB-PSB1]|nr:MAG: hypothetical protein N838_15925 [Thiohalocapsa sp. PB-PSB1]HCS91907.1 hypothetical protein [Chromatiaceae bacterium]
MLDITKCVWEEVCSAFNEGTVFLVGSAAGQTRAEEAGDIDIIAVTHFVTLEPYLQFTAGLQENCVCFSSSPNVSEALLELRHGPFKPPNGVKQLHLALHTTLSIQDVPLITRVDWATAASFCRGGDVRSALRLENVANKTLWASFLEEIARLVWQVDNDIVLYRTWEKAGAGAGEFRLVQNQAVRSRLCSDRVFARHVIRASVANATLLLGRQNQMSSSELRKIVHAHWPESIGAWDSAAIGEHVSQKGLLAHLKRLESWGRITQE